MSLLKALFSVRMLLLAVLLALPTLAFAQDAAAEVAASAPVKSESYLMWLYNALGWYYALAFLLLSFALVALVVMNFMQVSRNNIVPKDLVDSMEAHLNAKQYNEAFALASNDDSFLGKGLTAGISSLTAGNNYSHAIEAMQEVGEVENMKLDHRLSYISLIGTISPMLGLLGTVDGMVQSFSVIASSVTTPKPSELAEGITIALMTTLVGLVLAIPAIAVYHFVRNRIAQLVLEVGIVSERIMSKFPGAPQPLTPDP